MELKSNNFGDFVSQRRTNLGLSLREFCRKYGYEPSYISRLENSILNAPSDKERLSALALALELKKESQEWVEFFALAASSRVAIPDDIKNDFPNMVKFLPAFFRTTQKEKMTKKDINNLVKLMRDDSNS
jgi:transcriptional regulator with XRE-family HTH domain